MENGFLSDLTFAGKTYVWRFWMDNRNTYYFQNQTATPFSFADSKLKSGDRVHMKVRSVNKDYFLFLKTLDLAYQAQDNPFFSEPVILHSNVKNGYGIFTISSRKEIQFVLP